MLSQEQIDFYSREGYLVVEDVLDQRTVLDPIRDEYAALLDHLVDAWVAAGEMPPPAPGDDFYARLLSSYRAGCDWFQPMDISLPGDRIRADTPMHFGAATFGLLTSPALLDIVEALIGPEIFSNPIQHVRLKPPSRALRGDEIRAHVGHTDWHQDRGVTHAEADRSAMVTVWIAVTDATLENGCLQVVPRHRVSGLLPHCASTQTGIVPGLLATDAARPLPVRSGGIVLFHPLTPHASRSNLSNGFRWSFDVRYNRTGDPTGRAHFPGFVARSRRAPASELRDWREWRRRWQAARARLAGQAHIPIHRWESSSPRRA